ncbi:AraC family transcriptional regulator [Rhizobium sp. G21]|uniref:AraC family transcriptional regulator n=1 Tax=Rhizobium sp. G21 TaxID=2758439 RepID=UPI0015FF3B6D|nr:AraC family transcriptional regulator [Rhizobium sp. G21]MBB1250296.1 helix-turn-helix transcriptional regulator [Rhizobium sp. G21]
MRNELGNGYLSSRAFTVTDISDLLGFSDVASFPNSFRRWNGAAPQAYRTALAGKPE